MPGAIGVFQSNLNNVGELIDLYFQDNITAAAGGGQTNATQLIAQSSRVTVVATANDSVKLPPFAAGRFFSVTNADPADNLAVFPPSGFSAGFTGLSANAAFILPAGATVRFECSSPTVAGARYANPVSGAALPLLQRTSIVIGSGVIPAANMAGAAQVTLFQSGATALTTPTAAAMLAAIPNGIVGQQWRLRIINTNAGTLTLTGDASVTITGTATLATQTWRDFDMVLTSATAATMSSVGTGTNS